LAELFADCYSKLSLPCPRDILDVGCGSGPLGIYFAEQFQCNVVGVELNPLACACCAENLSSLALANRFRLVCGDFQQFAADSDGMLFDLIVSVPPVDTSTPPEMIQRYVGQDFQVMDSQSFAYLTNSWHSEGGADLLELIFRYGRTHLRDNGRIVIAFCLIDCEGPAYVLQKAKQYHYICTDQIEKTITPESVGAGGKVTSGIRAFVMSFSVEKGIYYGNPGASGI
jgi:methylase of polypeptide subunit release factors